ncbi:MAG: hypothetical protein ABI724_12780 [Betaproteobacteria bacterium]
MVTDLQGKATASGDGQTYDLTILAELEAGAKIQLGAGANLVVLYLDGGDEYVFKGPSMIEFRPKQPEVQSGAKPERRDLTLGNGAKDIRIKAVGMAQVALVMRDIRANARIQLLSLHNTRTLEARPEFRWTALQPASKYVFKLADETGRMMYEAEVIDTSIKLPAVVQLKEGVPYTWEVSVRMPDGKKYSSSAEFAIAHADLRAQAKALRPAASARLSTRIAYAAWLNQMDLKDEARTYWEAASAERPEDARLRGQAAQ